MTASDRTIAIIGDGQMGLVLADALTVRGCSARIFSSFEESADQIRSTRTSRRLPGFELDDRVEITTDPARATEDATLIINAIPTQYIRDVWTRLAPQCSAESPPAPVVSVSKGLELETQARPTQVISDVISHHHPAMTSDNHAVSVGVLSGPTIAAELARHLPASMVIASPDEDLAHLVQDVCHVPWLRVYRHNDMIGVELAGAAKNVIALAAGIVDGLGIGDNAKSALLARGLAEIARLGVALGARIDTFFGVAGVGDLATTCFSPEGRNRSCGEQLGRGHTLDAILASTSSVVEGVPTCKVMRELAGAHAVDMPITEAVHAILFEDKSPNDAIRDLMGRALKAERIG